MSDSPRERSDEQPSENRNRDDVSANEAVAAAESAQVQIPEAQMAEVQTAEGQAAEGQTAEGQTAEGQTAEGQTAEGQAMPELTPATPKRSRTLFWVLVGLGVGGVVALCSCLALATFATFGVRQATNVGAEVKPVLDQFLRAVSEGRAEDAYQLFTARARSRMSFEDFEKGLQGQLAGFYTNYAELELNSVNLSLVANTNPNVPQGQVANVTGRITYQDGSHSTLQASLQQDDGVWRIWGVNVNKSIGAD